MRWNPLGQKGVGGLPSLEFRAHFFLIMCFGPRCICAHVQIVACDYGIMRAHRQLMLLTREARGKTDTRLSTAVAQYSDASRGGLRTKMEPRLRGRAIPGARD